jgi:hypothetical protein
LPNSSNFKYYIHDGAGACRLQLLGHVGESEVAELSSCWQTARTILGGRRLILDLHEVTSVDDTGKKWLAQMVQDGAACLPESFLIDAMAGKVHPRSESPACAKFGWLSRVLSFFRGARVRTAGISAD